MNNFSFEMFIILATMLSKYTEVNESKGDTKTATNSQNRHFDGNKMLMTLFMAYAREGAQRA